MAAPRLTMNQLSRAFGVTIMTLWTWRKGTPTKLAIPHEVHMNGLRPVVTFKPSEVKTWAKKHGIEFAIDPADPTLQVPAPKAPAKVAKKATKPVAKKAKSKPKGRTARTAH